MIRQILLILLLVLVFGFIKSSGQAIITKSDSIPVGQDSVVKLILPEYRGKVSWQQSIDKINWFTNTFNLSDTLEIYFELDAFYRAKIEEGSCNPVFSDTIKIIISDSLKENTSGAFEPPNFIFHNSEVVYFTKDTDTIVCRKMNDNYIFQGDMILSLEQIQMILSNTKSAGMHPNFENYFWKNNIVYYRIDEGITENQSIIQAISHWNLKTTLSFIEVPKDYQGNFIEFIQWDENYCLSALGMHGKKQFIRLRKGAVEKEIIHEIGHAVGLIHEHSRVDRDDWIDVNLRNVRKEFRDQFSKCPMKHIMTEIFDYTSVMMYPAKGYQEDVVYDINIPTITIKGGNPFYTPHDKLTKGDISLIKKLYPPIESSNTFTDARDGKTYNTVKIGNQTWMAENLAYLPEVNPPSTSSGTEPHYYVYNYDGNNVGAAKSMSNYTTYGVLYNWPAAIASCPDGWHLPDDEEWEELAEYISDQKGPYNKNYTDWNQVGKHLKSSSGWEQGGNGIDDVGFTGLPAGGFAPDVNFNTLSEYTMWWTSTENSTQAFHRDLLYVDDTFYQDAMDRNIGASVRCLKNESTESEIQIGNYYQGGIIFYIDDTGQHGLIAAQTDQSTGISWYNGTYKVTGATGTAVGTGKTNTDAVVSSMGEGNYAAGICQQLTLNGYSDWFLPGKEELNLLFNLESEYKLSNNDYWSSTESGGTGFGSGAWYRSISSNGYGNEHYSARVRAIRAF